MDNESFELNRELRELNLDRDKYKTELTNEQYRIANLLKNEMGKDIQDVLSGKVKVKLSFKERIKYFFDKIFNTF